MRDTQAVVVDWMRRTLERRGWSAEHWAKEAGVAGTTVTRAMQPSYPGVTSLHVLDRLARAAGVTSPLDALRPDKIVVDVPDPAEMLELLTDKSIEFLRDEMRRRIQSH